MQQERGALLFQEVNRDDEVPQEVAGADGDDGCLGRLVAKDGICHEL